MNQAKPLIGGIEKRVIEISDYNHDWPVIFQQQAERIRNAIGPAALQIEHIGSTAVPGLGAKPIIDMLLVVADSADESLYCQQLAQASSSGKP